MASPASAMASSSHVASQRQAHPATFLPVSPSVLLKTKVLVVGAGGIGCEVLKNLSLIGVGGVQVIDLDTIDLSNLNRQFLFNKSHIKKPKSLIAASVASSFNSSVPPIQPHHANIKEPQWGYEFFKSFDVVLNALDNLDARRWVNKMCIATGVPLVESGTTGFLGQVQPIVKGSMACYDCTEKQTPKTYPVCTIRSTPSTPIHCVVWAKTWLFSQLFGEDDETENSELDKAEADGGNSDEIDALRNEAMEMRKLRSSLSSPGAAQRVFDKVFKGDIERLLSMDEMWRSRKRPDPIAFEEAWASTEAAAGTSNGEKRTLKDQTQLTLKETVELFQRSLEALATRAAASPSEPLAFDKDDDDALDFVTASSNLRSRAYHIEIKTRFDIKQMAGNIIPAIASTNAIISGALILQMLHMLSGKKGERDAKDVMLGRSNRFVLTGTEPPKPNPACGICQDVYVPLAAESGKATLGQLLELARRSRDEGGLGIDEEVELGVYEGSRLLADPDFEDNHEKSLASLGISTGKFVALVDEDGVKRTVQFLLCEPREGTPLQILMSDGELPQLTDRPALPKPAAEEDNSDDDIVADADEDNEFEILDAAPAQPSSTGASESVSSKKRKAAEDEVQAATTNGETVHVAYGVEGTGLDVEPVKPDEVLIPISDLTNGGQPGGPEPEAVQSNGSAAVETGEGAPTKKRRAE